jgi:hypothetical protein
LVFVLLLDLAVHLHLSHALTAEFVLQISGLLDQLLLVLDELGGLVEGVFEGFYPIALEGNPRSLIGYFALQLLLILE